MIKQMIAIVVVLLAGGAWLYLDCLNKHEKGSAELLHQGVVQSRAEAKKRADMKTNFDAQLATTLGNCNAAADTAKTSYMALVEQTAPRKRGQVLIPQSVADESDKVVAAAKAECQQVYDSRLKSGI
jgi:hypothetical protein